MQLLVALESENFPAQRRALRLPGPPPPGRLGSPVVPPRELLAQAGGGLLRVDWPRLEVTGRASAPMPSGLCWPDPGGPIWAACQFPAELRWIDPQTGATLNRVVHGAFNDLHRMVPRPGGGVFLVCSGTDSVLALDEQGAEVWSWWGSPEVDRAAWHPDREIPTLDRRIHPISVAALGPDSLLLTSFHHGSILEIHRDRPAKLRLEGLQQPHGLVPTPDGWLVADTGRGRILRLDPALKGAAVVAEGFRWLQDLAPTPDGGVWVLENRDFRGSVARAGGPRLLELDARGRERARLELSPEWRLAALLPLDPPRAARLSWPSTKVRSKHSRAEPAETGRG